MFMLIFFTRVDSPKTFRSYFCTYRVVFSAGVLEKSANQRLSVSQSTSEKKRKTVSGSITRVLSYCGPIGSQNLITTCCSPSGLQYSLLHSARSDPEAYLTNSTVCCVLHVFNWFLPRRPKTKPAAKRA